MKMGLPMKAAIAACWTICAARAAEPIASPPGKPEYPLYSPFFGSAHRFTDSDLKAIATAFDFVYGQALTKQEMDVARRINPEVRFIKYIGAWTVRADAAERGLRKKILYYPAAVLAEGIDARATEFVLGPVSSGRNVSVVASNIEGEYSKNAAQYVTWLRVDEELMRVDSFDAGTGRVRVRRGFDGSVAGAHAKDSRIFLPSYGVAPAKPNEWESKGTLSYHYDPAFTARWEHIHGVLEEFVSGGGDGIWIDILMDRSLRESDVDGKELPPPGPGLSGSWDFRTGQHYQRDEFRRRNEEGVRLIQDRYFQSHGKHPVIYANNMMASRYEKGTGGHKLYLLPTEAKPRPLDGMCIEDFMGGYGFEEWAIWTKSKTPTVPAKACYPCEAGYKNWAANTTMLMAASQAGLKAIPLIINAGMKTAIFEAMDRKARHEWELWAYASYLLAVEKRNGVTPTKLGVPMFYRDGERRFVAIDPMYYWPIGEPAESKPPSDLAKYQLAGTEVFARKFTNGMVLVNPGSRVQPVKLAVPLIDPESGKAITSFDMAPQSGRILLKQEQKENQR